MVDFIYAPSLVIAENLARDNDWTRLGPSKWKTPKGNEVFFLRDRERLCGNRDGVVYFHPFHNIPNDMRIELRHRDMELVEMRDRHGR
jgi:hypothetical protein